MKSFIAFLTLSAIFLFLTPSGFAEETNALDAWRQQEYYKLYCQQLRNGKLVPSVPDAIRVDPTKCEYYRAGFIRAIRDNRLLANLTSVDIGAFHEKKEDGLFGLEYDGYIEGTLASMKLGLGILASIDEKIARWLKEDSMPQELKAKIESGPRE